MNKKLPCLLIAASLFPTMLLAQLTISGKVTDAEDDASLPGVNILVSGTANGTVTDFDGNYTLTVNDASAVLVFSFVGYITQEVAVDARNVINIQLAPDVTELSEIVVVGYGTQVKQDVTGSISQIKAEDIMNAPLPSFDGALQGKAAGLQVVQSNGVPGSAVRVRVRGQTSISGNSDPLYVVDGVPITNGDFSKRDGAANSVNNNALAQINPNDIESIEVLKDAYASAIYGSRGANGVILITTKKGASGKTKFNLSYYEGVTEITDRIDFLNGAEWLSLYEEAYRNSNETALPPDFNLGRGLTPASVLAAGTDTDWVDAILRDGSVREATLSASGGNEQTRFYTAFTYRQDESIFLGNSLERIQGRINIDNNATDKLTLGTQIGITRLLDEQITTSFGQAQSGALRVFPVRNADGTFFGSTGEQGTDGFPDTGFNPVAQLENDFETSSWRVLSNVYADYEIIENLHFRAEYGLDYFDQFDLIKVARANRFLAPQDFADVPNGGTPIELPIVNAGSFEERKLTVTNWNTNITLSYDRALTDLHYIQGTVGFSAQSSTQRTSGIFTNGNAGFRDPFFDDVSEGLVNFDQNLVNDVPEMGGYNADIDNRFTFASFFGRANYKYKNRYLVGLSLRTDASSRFGPGNRWGFFPAASAGWIMSDEEFFDFPVINFLKIRGSYGVTGNAEIPNFSYLATYGPTDGYLGNAGTAAVRIPNPDLKWERNNQLDIGVDFELLEGRISGSLAYYDKRSTDLLFFVPIQSSTGFGSILTNTDIEIKNTGFEFAINTINVDGDLKWTTSFNISTPRNEVISTGGLGPDAFASGLGETRVIEGQPVGINFVMRSLGVDPADGRETFLSPEGEAVKLGIEERGLDWLHPEGQPFPDFVGGISNTFSYKGLSLDFLFTFSSGNTIYDNEAKFQIGEVANNNQRREVLGRWQSPENPGDGETPGLFLSGPGSGRALNSDRFIYDASFLRLRNVTLSYNLPSNIVSKAGLNSARVYVTGQNLLLFTEYPFGDPEFVNTFNQGNTGEFFRPFGATNDVSRFQQANLNFNVAQNPLPQTRTFLVGVNLGF